MTYCLYQKKSEKNEQKIVMLHINNNAASVTLK